MRPSVEQIIQALETSGGSTSAANRLREQGLEISERTIRRMINRGDLEQSTRFQPLPGHVIKGVSALVDENGEVKQQWIKTKQGQLDLTEAIKTAFDEYKGHAVLPPVPLYTNKDLATFYNCADLHFGMYSWKDETGEDYDIKIAERLLLEKMGELVALSPPSDEAIVLNLGDFFHIDNSENRTLRSGNALDVDTRYAKVLSLGVKLLIAVIELALQKHSRVTARMLPGNHDPHSSLMLAIALDAFFDGNPRVTIDTNPGKFFHWKFGKVMVGATHGDMAKPQDMPGIMASRHPEDWGSTKYRYAYMGHVHHVQRGGEGQGVIWESFQTLAPKDAWHASQKYFAGRGMTAITHHRERGEHIRHVVSL